LTVHVARMSETVNAYRILAGKLLDKSMWKTKKAGEKH